MDQIRRGRLSYLLLVLSVIVVSVTLVPCTAHAEDLSHLEDYVKSDTKMSGELEDLYHQYSQNAGISVDDAVSGMAGEDQMVFVVIEFYSEQYSVPEGLGIEVTNMGIDSVDALVPIVNMRQLADHPDVRHVGIPYGPIPLDADDTVAPMADEPDVFLLLHYLVLVVVLVSIAVSLVAVWRAKKGKRVVNS